MTWSGPTHSNDLMVRFGEPAQSDAARARARELAIEWHLPLTAHLARRFSGRGEPIEDLIQVAAIGLIKAVDGFDASRGFDFTSYAIPTIIGELKRYFRDKAWNIRVPRRLQELMLQLAGATEELAQALRRSPTTAELADRLGVTQADIVAARACSHAYRPMSIDRPAPDGMDRSMGDSLGAMDVRVEAVDDRVALSLLLAKLPLRERRILVMRFTGEMTQSEIALELGVSQMQISRLLARSLARLQVELAADGRRRGNGSPAEVPRQRAVLVA
jgi:RNA polymerase sigma-B factor